MRMFQELGEQIQRTWRKQNYNDRCFTDIVVETLQRSSTWGQEFRLEDYVTWLQGVERLPPQGDFKAGLGQTPLIVFESGRFYLGLYFWRDLITTIHSPSAHDVYGILRGRCLEARYAFEPSKEHFSPHLLWGALTLSEVRHLSPGSVTAVELQDIHSLYSLDELAVVLVARTNAIQRLNPVYEYCPPGVAVDAFYRDPLASRQLQTLTILSEVDETQYLRLAFELIQSSDLETVYRVLENLVRSGVRFAEHAARAMELAKARFGDIIPVFAQSFQAHFRNQLILEEQRATKEPVSRLLWTLAHIKPGRESVLKTVAAHFPGVSPQEVVAGFLNGFSTCPKDELRVDEVSAFLVGRLFEGDGPEQAVRRLARVYGEEAVGGAVQQLLAQCEALRKHPIFSAFL